MNDSVRNYLIVTASYWGFTLTDGALRMLVLFHFFTLGYSPFTLAFLFLLYEFAGILANLCGGWLAVRFGIPRMLATGQILQILGLLMLTLLEPHWGAVMSVAWVVLAQGVAGLAKDFTKTASKSAIKATADQSSGQLFRWVAWFTGSKNAMKGIGFFIGGLLLDAFGFGAALWSLAVLIALILVAGIVLLPRELGKASASKSIRELFSKSRGVNLLALARIFLFGARDVWFVVGLPVFLYSAGWSFVQAGGFLAAWTIAYGGIQAVAPRVIRRSEDGLSSEVPAARGWSLVLVCIPLLLAIALALPGLPRADLLVVVALTLFGLPFAVNSSLHSYLILAYAGSKKVAEDVGFYYAANAAGRLIGIVLSGLLYQLGGLIACLLGSAVMLAGCWLITLLLPGSAERSSSGLDHRPRHSTT
ncbi:MAG: organoarsenical effux MFS transporter ArsJ [Gammaproteobacteria bacterium]|nr:organoarsenical effux MFS transporter ArsJ [Gammaproteobacteria bacterium]